MNRHEPIAIETLEAAAAWFGELSTGDMSHPEKLALDAWLRADPVHVRAYREVERSWLALEGVANDPTVLGLRGIEDFGPRKRPWRRALAASIAAGLTLGTGFAAYRSGLVAAYGFGPRPIQSFTNDVGQRSNVVLADGSTVTLDTDSEVRVLAMGATRTLELVRGRAFFVVAKDAVHPFLVRAAGRVVRATATEFSVGLEKHDVTVALVEGSVNVSEPARWFNPSRMMRMRAGTTLAAADTDWKVSPLDPARETSWLTGQLVFVATPLSEAINEVNRYSKKTLTFRGNEVPDKQIFGMFHAGNVDQLARAIELEGFGHIESDSRTEIIMSRSDNVNNTLYETPTIR